MERIVVDSFRGNRNGKRRLRSAAMTREKENRIDIRRKKVDEDNNEKNGRKCG